MTKNILRTIVNLSPFPKRFASAKVEVFYALISTSTPEGKSNLLSASTVLELEV